MRAEFDHHCQQYHINIMNISLPNSCCTLLGTEHIPHIPSHQKHFEDADFPNFPLGGIYM